MQEELACEETLLRRAMVGSGNESVPSKSRPSARKLREAYENLSPKPMWFYLQVLSTGIDKNLQESQAKKRKATVHHRNSAKPSSWTDHFHSRSLAYPSPFYSSLYRRL